jgi:hypothetical protein
VAEYQVLVNHTAPGGGLPIEWRNALAKIPMGTISLPFSGTSVYSLTTVASYTTFQKIDPICVLYAENTPTQYWVNPIATGTLQYVGTRTLNAQITYHFSTQISGGAQTYGIQARKNNVPLTQGWGYADSVDKRLLYSMTFQTSMALNDYIDIWVSCSGVRTLVFASFGISILLDGVVYQPT